MILTFRKVANSVFIFDPQIDQNRSLINGIDSYEEGIDEPLKMHRVDMVDFISD